jgi:small subunit ribosomal protein S2
MKTDENANEVEKVNVNPTEEQNEYLEVGMHIGTKTKTPGMSRFIYKVREDGLYLLNLQTIDERIKVAGKMLARYDPDKIVITASRIYAIAAAEKFAEITKTRFIKGRVMPGLFTNPNRDDYLEPDILLVSDTRNERQAIREAKKMNIPVISLCDTDNWVKFVDMIIPCNNKGRKSLAMIYYILAKEFMKEKGLITSENKFNYTVSDFEAKLEMKAK